MKRKLYSIGYTGYSVDDFIATLVDNGVQCLVDTRELPISRKKGFAKSALRNHLLDAGLEYHHFRCLGSPRSDRHAVRETGDYGLFFSRVRKHLENVEAVTALHEIAAMARLRTTCLMCCCSDWHLCHRSCVVEAITSRTYFDVTHLEKSVVRSIRRRAA